MTAHPSPLGHPWHERTHVRGSKGRAEHHRAPSGNSSVAEERASLARLDPIDGCAPCVGCGRQARSFNTLGEAHCLRCGRRDPQYDRARLTVLA